MEGKVIPVYGLCSHGRWFGWQCGASPKDPLSCRLCNSLDRPLTFLQTVLVLKYIVPSYADNFTYYGYANVGQNVALMLSAVVLWLAQNTPSEYEYRLSL